MHNAGNFSNAMRQSWEASNPSLSTDANKRARLYRARRVENFWRVDAFYREIPGDDPSGVWEFPDHSIAIIGDSGHWLKPFASLRALERHFPRGAKA